MIGDFFYTIVIVIIYYIYTCVLNNHSEKTSQGLSEELHQRLTEKTIACGFYRNIFIKEKNEYTYIQCSGCLNDDALCHKP